MTPREVGELWVECFNNVDLDGMAELYDDNAVNHQMPLDKIVGKEEILEMFKREFAAANMVCIPEQILEDGEWAVLEWKDPKNFSGCGFFHVQHNKIIMQRGYWDRL